MISCPCKIIFDKQIAEGSDGYFEKSEKNIIYAIYLEERIKPTFKHFNSTDFNYDELSDDIDIKINDMWHAFWAEWSDNLVLNTWKIKYKNHMELTENYKNSNANTEDSVCFCASVNLDELLNILEMQLKGDQENCTLNPVSESDWDVLWANHYEAQYTLHYSIFKEIFLSLTTLSKIDVSNRNHECIEYKETSEAPSNMPQVEYISLDDTEELLLLGLPASFGRKKKSKKSYIEMNEDDETSRNDESNKSFDIDDKHHFDLHVEENSASGLSAEQIKSDKIENSKPEIITKDKILLKYWKKRFSLFSRFDEGIQLDRESWFSVTPEKVAKHIAKRLKCPIVIDAFCGSGGNTIQFAFSCEKVIAIDIDPAKIALAKNNAKVYGVEKKIEFIIGNIFDIYHKLFADVIFLSPPWGGPDYTKNKTYDIEKDMPIPILDLLEKCRTITPDIGLYLPRNVDTKQVLKTAGIGNKLQVERNFLDRRTVALMVYYGNLVK